MAHLPTLETLHLGGQTVSTTASPSYRITASTHQRLSGVLALQVSPAVAGTAGELLRSHSRLQVLGLRRCLTGVEGMIAFTSGVLPADHQSGRPGTPGHGFLWRAARLRLELQQSRLSDGGSIPLSTALSHAERYRIQDIACVSPTLTGFGHKTADLDLELGYYLNHNNSHAML